MMNRIVCGVLGLGLSSGLGLAAPVPVTVSVTDGMQRGGKPYFVKGGGGDTHLDELAARGGNSIRTWSNDGLAEVLDNAAKRGLTVSAGIWLEPECSWFSYANAEHCAKQAERVRGVVMEYKDHAALLAWGLGNEAEGDGSNAAFWQQLERLALLVKDLDAAHPSFTAVAGLSAQKAKGLDEFAPHLDYVGVNTYGGLFSLRAQLAAMGWARPWMLTEWGAQGFWERPKSKWGAPLEQTSTEKATMLRRGYDEVITKGGACLGSYVFIWGWKFEASATWFGLWTNEGESTEGVDVLEEAWRGKRPVNVAPSIEVMRGAPADAVKSGDTFDVATAAKDADGDELKWRWAVLPEDAKHDANKRPEMPKSLAGGIASATSERATVKVPNAAGRYRVYVWVSDGHGHVATANAPFEARK